MKFLPKTKFAIIIRMPVTSFFAYASVLNGLSSMMKNLFTFLQRHYILKLVFPEELKVAENKNTKS